MCYIMFGLCGAFFFFFSQQVQYELYLQWKCEGNRNGSSVIWEFLYRLGWPQTVMTVCGKLMCEPSLLIPALSVFASSSSQPAAPSMLFMPAFEMQPQQKVCGSLNVQGGITKLRRESGNRSQVCDECPVLKEKLSPVFYGCYEILEKVVINNMSAQNHCNMRLQFVKGGVGDWERTGYWQLQVPHFAPLGNLNCEFTGTIRVQGVKLYLLLEVGAC